MTKEERELINQQFATLRAEIRGENEVIMLMLAQIKVQTEKTNGRVSKLEEQTAIGRWFERNPKRFVAVFIMFLILSAKGGIDLIEKIWTKLF